MDGGKKIIIGVIAITTVMLLGGVWLISGRQTAPEQINLVPEDAQMIGAKTGNVTLVEFGDFQCSACKVIMPVVKQLVKEFPANLTFVWRNFPLGQHKNSRIAAYAGEAAGKQGKFWEMYEKLFSTTEQWAEIDAVTEKFTEYAGELGLDKEKFIKDMASPEVTGKIQRDITQAGELDIPGTPTFYLNGKLLDMPANFESFRSIIKTAAENTPMPTGAAEKISWAKFKVILDGEPVDFTQSKYQSSPSAMLNENLYLENGNGEEIKIKKAGTKIADLFESMKILFTSTCFELDTGERYCNGDQKTLKMYINGVVSGEYQNYIPLDGDKLLITFGDETVAEVQKQIDSIAN